MVPITIVGAGQMGSMIAYHLLKDGHKVRVIDSGTKTQREHKQTPWGWLRKFSLQSKAKKELVVHAPPIYSSLLSNLNVGSTYGPMLITSKKNKSIHAWRKWISQNPETDSHVLLPNEASKHYHLSEDYFKGQGGVYVCDTRDSLIDYSLLNEYLWDYMASHRPSAIQQS